MAELRELVEQHDGVLTTTMEVLRDAYGKARLGSHVRDGIQKALEHAGLGHWPRVLPEYQHKWVRIYLRGRAVGEVIDAVLRLSPKNDELLRRVAGGTDAEVLKQIRELVCP